MNSQALALAALLAAAPAVVLAQAAPPDMGSAGGDGPSPALRATMERIRDDARTASIGALSADHRTRVLAIVDRFDAGTIADRADAAAQIDAVLSPAEAKDEVARAQRMRADMRAAFTGGAPDGAPGRGGGPPDGGPAAGGPAAGGGPPGGGDGPGAGRGPATNDDARGGRGRHATDPGRFLLQVAADPAKLRAGGMGERPPQR